MPYAQLASAKTTTGAGTVKQWFGGFGTCSANGFGSAGAVRLQFSPASSTGPWVSGSTAYALSAATSAASFNFQVSQGWIRPLVTVASTTGLNFWVH